MSNSAAGRAAIDALRGVVAAFPGAEERQGQVDMAYTIAEAITSNRSVIIQAGTGTGKSLGYLVPAVLSGRKTVVATATKGLQDQLHNNDLPLVHQRVGKDFTWAVIKGRSNYVCMQRIEEFTEDPDTLFDTTLQPRVRAEVDKIVAWSRTSASGDLEEVPFAFSDAARRTVSVGVDECPGRNKCPKGGDCFAERARDAAVEADVVVVNLHLYGIHLASEGSILPEHDIVVFDEAHQLESVLSDTVGTSISSGRISSLTAALRQVLADPGETSKMEEHSLRLASVLAPLAGERLSLPVPPSIVEVLTSLRADIMGHIGVLRELKTDNESIQQRIYRATTQATRLTESIDIVLGSTTGFVYFVEGNDSRAVLKVSPLHVGDVLARQVWDSHVAILTSATIPNTLPERVGLDRDGVTMLSVDSPFDYERNSRLYCSPEFPDRNSAGFTDFVHDELEALITAAGGRTLALFTSNKALNAAVAEMRNRLDFTILTPAETPRHVLIEKFMDDESSCIFASQSFFQGIDLPGRTLSLVVIDKLPFPRPDEPLLEARREAVGRQSSFQLIDLPLTATALAQAVGRLIRTSEDKGVVAVLDRRLATANYWRTLIGALPPMSRTRHRHDVEQFLRDITAGPGPRD